MVPSSMAAFLMVHFSIKKSLYYSPPASQPKYKYFDNISLSPKVQGVQTRVLGAP